MEASWGCAGVVLSINDIFYSVRHNVSICYSIIKQTETRSVTATIAASYSGMPRSNLAPRGYPYTGSFTVVLRLTRHILGEF